MKLEPLLELPSFALGFHHPFGWVLARIWSPLIVYWPAFFDQNNI
jgi:hypothetical protein